jgi:ribulose-phosphate 3-epimerase
MAEVIPAILENDFAEIGKKIKLIEKLVKWVQIDFADNTLVPNSTDWDIANFSSIKSVNLEAHLMVKDPLRYVEKFAQAGFKRFFAHVEGDFVEEFIEKCLQMGVEVGLAIDGPTDFEKIHKYLDDIDVVLVMAIEAGFSGRPFREDTLLKIKKIRDVDFEIPIAVDGAMSYENAVKVVTAGANRINSNSYIFKEKDVSIPIAKLRSIVVPTVRTFS